MAKNTSDEDTKDIDLEGDDDGVGKRSEADIEGRKADGADDDGEQDRDADDTGDAKSDDAVGFRKRLAKLTAQRNDARQKAADREVLAARVRAYEQRELDQVTKQEKERSKTPEAMKAEERRQAIREMLEEGIGRGALDDIAELRAERQTTKEAYAHQGISYLKSELEDHGIVITDNAMLRWERAVGSELAEDASLHAAFRRPGSQQAAIQEAFKRVRDGLANPAIEQQGGKPLERIERNRQAVLGSGSRDSIAEPTHDPKPPKNLSGRALQEWWATQRDKLWAELNAADRA